jgi:hypothetical protein
MHHILLALPEAEWLPICMARKIPLKLVGRAFPTSLIILEG